MTQSDSGNLWSSGRGWAIALIGTGAMSVVLTLGMIGQSDDRFAALDELIGDAGDWPIGTQLMALDDTTPENGTAFAQFVQPAKPPTSPFGIETADEAKVIASAPQLEPLQEPAVERPLGPVLAELAVPDFSEPAVGTPGLEPILRSDLPNILVESDHEIDSETHRVALLAGAQMDPEVSAAIEQDLGLTARQRTVIQRRLVLAGFDPRGVDGIFGEGTRTAIADLQASEGLPASGYIDAPTLLALTDSTSAKYARWKKARRDARTRSVSLSKAEVPPQRPRGTMPERTKGCARDANGRIIAYQGFVCDLAGMGEALVNFDAGGAVARDNRVADALQRDHR